MSEEEVAFGGVGMAVQVLADGSVGFRESAMLEKGFGVSQESFGLTRGLSRQASLRCGACWKKPAEEQDNREDDGSGQPRSLRFRASGDSKGVSGEESRRVRRFEGKRLFAEEGREEL
jgi:hypothetical protein